MAAIYFLAKRGTPAARFPYAWISSESAEFATMVETVIEAGDFTFAAEDGTVTAPGFTFSADTNTGIYRVGSDRLGITAGGSLIAEFYTSVNTQYFSVAADYSYMPVGTFSIPGIGFRSGATTFKSGIGVEINSKSLIFFAEGAVGANPPEYVAAATLNVGFAGVGQKQFLVAPNTSANIYPAFAFWHNAPVPGVATTGIDSTAYTDLSAVVNSVKQMEWTETGSSFYGLMFNRQIPQALSGPGAINITTNTTTITTTGADAFTLADGAVGQYKTIVMIVDGGDATITPTNLLGYTTITMGDVGDCVILQFIGTEWAVISNQGCALA